MGGLWVLGGPGKGQGLLVQMPSPSSTSFLPPTPRPISRIPARPDFMAQRGTRWKCRSMSTCRLLVNPHDSLGFTRSQTVDKRELSF